MLCEFASGVRGTFEVERRVRARRTKDSTSVWAAASSGSANSPSEAGIDALAAAAGSDRPVVATLLPVTTWFLMKDRHAPARTFIDRGIPVAIGTDFNPGTSPTPSVSRPPESRSSVAVSLATLTGRRRGAIRRAGLPPLAFFERPEWMRAWFPGHTDAVIECCRRLNAILEPDGAPSLPASV